MPASCFKNFEIRQTGRGFRLNKMVVTCEISFDNNKHGTFYAGQLVSGCVTLKSDKIKEVQGIYI